MIKLQVWVINTLSFYNVYCKNYREKVDVCTNNIQHCYCCFFCLQTRKKQSLDTTAKKEVQIKKKLKKLN